jgi:hypothetical protein
MVKQPEHRRNPFVQVGLEVSVGRSLSVNSTVPQVARVEFRANVRRPRTKHFEARGRHQLTYGLALKPAHELPEVRTPPQRRA